MNLPTSFLFQYHSASVDRISNTFVSDVDVIVYNDEKLIYFLIFHLPLGYLDNPVHADQSECVSVCVYVKKTSNM